MSNVFQWVESHKLASAAIGVGALVLFWFLFLRGGSSSGSSDGGMAAAYYAAEAQQAVVGGQIQMATIQATRDTAIAQAGDNAATAIATTQANAAVKVNSSNNRALVATVNSNNDALKVTTDSNNRASILANFFNTIFPTELNTFGQAGTTTNLPGVGTIITGGGLQSPSQLQALGFGPKFLAGAGGA